MPVTDKPMTGRSGEKLLVDWFRVIVDLERKGYGPTIIALSIDAPKTTILGWKQGSRPRFEEGDSLIDLWCRVVGKNRSDLPKSSPYDFRR